MRRFALGFVSGTISSVAIALSAAEVSGTGLLRGWIVVHEASILCASPYVHPTKKIIDCLVMAPR